MSATDVRDTTVPGPHGRVPVRLYQPADPSGVGLVWVHGGGFLTGDLDVPEAHWVSGRLAAAGVSVVSVHYRLANDGVHFPVPGDDVLAAWEWTVAEPRMGVEPADWHLGGGSAGANLAGSVALQLRDAGRPVPRSSVLVYPVMHDELPVAPEDLARRVAQAPIELRFPPEKCRWANLNYVGDEALLQHPYAFPAHAELLGLPPTLVVTAELDELRTSGEAYAAALAVAGVDVSLVREVGTWHGYLNEPETPAAGRTVDRLAAWLRRADLLGEPHVPAPVGAALPPLPAWVGQGPGEPAASS